MLLFDYLLKKEKKYMVLASAIHIAWGLYPTTLSTWNTSAESHHRFFKAALSAEIMEDYTFTHENTMKNETFLAILFMDSLSLWVTLSIAMLAGPDSPNPNIRPRCDGALSSDLGLGGGSPTNPLGPTNSQ